MKFSSDSNIYEISSSEISHWQKAFAVIVVLFFIVSQAEAGQCTVHATAFSKDEANAERDANVQFQGSVSGAPQGATITWSWDFGGGNTSSAQNPTHAFDTTRVGPRTVTLTVTVNGNNAGSDTVLVNVVDRVIIDEVEGRPQNKMSFNNKNNVKGHVLPRSLASLDNKLDWDMDDVPTADCKLFDDAEGDLDWSQNWPTDNGDWGTGDALILTIDRRTGEDDDLDTSPVGTTLQASITMAKYYQGDGNENTSADPNWFYYYKDNEGGADYNYGANAQGRSYSTAGGGMASVHMADSAYNKDGTDNNKYRKFSHPAPAGLLIMDLDGGGNLEWSGENQWYAAFIGVLRHESQHAMNEVAAGTGTDTDSDFLPTAFENATSKTVPTDKDSAHPGGDDDGENYAGGPVEKDGFDNADTSEDWAHPGTNWN